MLTMIARVRHPIRATINGRYPCLIARFLSLTPALLTSAELGPETVKEWNAYVHAAKEQMAARARKQAPFLWVDENCHRAQRVRAGEVLVEPLGNSPRTVTGGLIHDWIGAVFVPRARLNDLERVLNDYDHYSDFYRPMVAKAALIEQNPEREKVRLLMTQKVLWVTAAVETENEVESATLTADREYSLSTSVWAEEIAHYGEQTQREFTEDQGPGYIWRTFSITRLEQRDGGVSTEMETIALSRGIPLLFRWLVQPLTERLPQYLLTGLLADTRDAVGQETRAALSIAHPIQH